MNSSLTRSQQQALDALLNVEHPAPIRSDAEATPLLEDQSCPWDEHHDDDAIQ